MNAPVTEGKARLEIPEDSLTRKSQTFYNPLMERDRTLSVGILAELGRKTVCDALCGSGVRAIRYTLESGYEAHANDANPAAAEVARENVARNGAEIPVTCMDANLLLRQEVFDVVDIDPFGSPVPFLDSAMCALHRNSYLFVTATDTAALSSSSPGALVRKYDVLPLACDFSKELGVRILLGKILRVAANHSFAPDVLLAYAWRHYVRVFLKMNKGKRRAASAFEGLGFAFSCACGFRSASSLPLCPCPHCGRPLSFSYPVYLGRLKDDALLARLADSDMVGTIRKECDVPFYYDVHRLSSLYRRTPKKMSDAIDLLHGKGFCASRTHFCPTGIKTDAGLDDVLSVL